MPNMQDNNSDLDRMFDRVINRIVLPILRHRDAICRDPEFTDDLSRLLVTNTVIDEMRERAKQELAAVYYGTSVELSHDD